MANHTPVNLKRIARSFNKLFTMKSKFLKNYLYFIIEVQPGWAIKTH